MSLLRYTVLVICLVLTSCATPLKSPDGSYIVNNENALIVGKADYIYNERKTDYSGKEFVFKKGITHFVNRFTSVEELDRGIFQTGKYSFKVTYDDKGYFVFPLPPGKYYFSAFCYFSLISGDACARTYENLPDFYMIYNPLIITFEIHPNSVNYVGTLKQMVYRYSWEKKLFKIEVVDEYEDANEWFKNSRFSTDKDLINNIATVTYINSDKK